ncbi:MAG: heparan-alpha-glucosaminide N-acetyltransferase [Sulfurimicrobium sp.]|nr:heparan-alpha-glucosaminide N-acetyltransferase [Sulfurimicrobium sp.]
MAPFPRIPLVDAARGSAIAMMVAFHFCFDLNFFHLASFDFYRDAFWLNLRAFIVTLFLLIVGISFHLANGNGFRAGPFLRRLGMLACCAAAVSAGSYAIFPASGIFFGVLHFIALASVLGLMFLPLHLANLVLGIAAIAAGLSLENAWFDQPWMSWIGFTTHKPISEDYVPLFPWFGVVLLGLYLGKTLSIRGIWKKLADWQPGSAPARLLCKAGKHSLAIYILHQPALLGILYIANKLMGA